MSKAEEFIHEHTMNCDNLLYRDYVGRFDETVYQPWLTPYKAIKAVEIAREEIYEWLSYHLNTSKMDVDYKFEVIEELRKAIKDE